MRRNYFTLAFLALGLLLKAQWNVSPWVNNALCLQPYDQQDPKIASDTKGGAIVTWLDYRADALMARGDIYIQRIDKNGYVKWALDGVALCTDTNHQTAPVITEDGVGGAIIAWVDMRSGFKDVYAQRIDSSGNVLWATNGVAVAAKGGDQGNPRVINDGSNGGIFVWEDDSIFTGMPDIFVQHIDATGNALWGAGGYRVCATVGSQINPKMISDGGGALITWQDKRTGNDYDIYAQRINSSGVSLWLANGQLVSAALGTQSNPKLVPDFFGGAVITWQDKRTGIDYDVYAQYMNNSGIAQWTANGKAVCSTIGSQSAIDITADATTGGAIISWKDMRNMQLDIYAQKIDLLGNLLWTGNGVQVCGSSNHQINPSSVPDGAGGAVIVWQDSTLANWDVRSQHINSSGALLWATAGVDVGVANGNQTSPKLIEDGLGGGLYVFQDKRGIDYDIYAYRIDANGIPYSIQSNTLNNGLKVYPNPSLGDINFEWRNGGEIALSIYDVTGKEVLQKKLGGNAATLNTGLAAGTYFYKVVSEKDIFNGKLIIAN